MGPAGKHTVMTRVHRTRFSRPQYVVICVVYVGQFANGFEHGTGTKTYRDGSVFEGANLAVNERHDIRREVPIWSS